METRRRFTVEEANALLPRVRELVTNLREALGTYRFHSEQVQDLRRMHGDAVEAPDHAHHDVFRRHVEAAHEGKRTTDALLREARDLGVEVKDPVLGLVDFQTVMEGQPAYLCWREGEDAVAFWHTMDAGFAGREPLEGNLG